MTRSNLSPEPEVSVKSTVGDAQKCSTHTFHSFLMHNAKTVRRKTHGSVSDSNMCSGYQHSQFTLKWFHPITGKKKKMSVLQITTAFKKNLCSHIFLKATKPKGLLTRDFVSATSLLRRNMAKGSRQDFAK